MDVIRQMGANRALICAVLAWFICQGIKGVTSGLKNRRWQIQSFIDSGGMPSSHSASVSALTTIVGIEHGFSSVLFAACFIFSCIVMYDAAGVRRETGKQSSMIKMLLGVAAADYPDMNDVDIKEKVGHSPLEVAVGAMIGILCVLVIR